MPPCLLNAQAARVALGAWLLEAVRQTEDGDELPAQALVETALVNPQPHPPVRPRADLCDARRVREKSRMSEQPALHAAQRADHFSTAKCNITFGSVTLVAQRRTDCLGILTSGLTALWHSIASGPL